MECPSCYVENILHLKVDFSGIRSLQPWQQDCHVEWRVKQKLNLQGRRSCALKTFAQSDACLGKSSSIDVSRRGWVFINQGAGGVHPNLGSYFAFRNLLGIAKLQGDQEAWTKPPVDIDLKFCFYRPRVAVAGVDLTLSLTY